MAKKIGILGGMTPESTVTYYERITRSYQKQFGDYGFPEVVIYSVSFQQYEDWMMQGNWKEITSHLIEGVSALHRAGTDFAVLATNTMHNVFPQIEEASPIPLISIIDATAEAIIARGMKTVGLLGTIFTMTLPFYSEGLDRHGIRTIVPSDTDMNTVNRIIFEELGKGVLKSDSRTQYVEIIHRLHRKGAEGVILGCTEIPLLVKDADCEIPLFDTTVIHADKALMFALE